MNFSDFDISASKLTEPSLKILDRAVEEVYRREHIILDNEHLFMAIIQNEWIMFDEIMRELRLNPNIISRAVEQYLSTIPASPGAQVRVSQSTRLSLKLALHRASRGGRQVIEPHDLLSSIFEDIKGYSPAILRRHGIEADVLISRLDAWVRENEIRDERLKKRFELPAFLKHFAVNLNLLARQDKLSPVFGRDKEIQQVLEILCHRERTNSVMLIGEPGVGKTAIAEGLARRLEFEPDTIPLRLRDSQIVSVQMNSLVAGTMLRGMFEERLQNVIRELKERPNLILFVDEAHTMVGAGSALGAPSDAANALKSVLARGEIKMIAATTLTEYKQHILEDEALARRFRCVNICEPTIDETRHILYQLRPRLQRNYSVKITDEAIDMALAMAPRYSRDLHLPDKVISWLDTASVKAEINKSLEVKSSDIVTVIANTAQIPEDMVFRNVTERFKKIEEHLEKRVIGQSEAVKAVARRLILNKGPLKDGFDRPDGVLLFLGPTGVGKTELAKALAEFLFGDEKKMIRIDMSEYKDGVTSVDKLIGMPRGIVGSERGGVLTTQLKDNPYSVVLLDEVEKARPSLLNLFLPAFSEGWLTDGRGKRVYLSDAVVIMTSNIGSHLFKKLTNPLGFADQQDPDTSQIMGEVKKEMNRTFSTEFINRIDDVIVFAPLAKVEVRQIAIKYLNEIKVALHKEGKTLSVDDDALDKLVADGYSLAFGARFLKREIDSTIKMPLSDKLNESSNFHVVLRDNKVEIEPNGIEGIPANKWSVIA